MSSPFELTVGSTRVLYGASFVDESLFLPFQSDDLQCRDADDDSGYLYFEAPCRVVGRRLDLLGFTMAAAEADYSGALESTRERSDRHFDLLAEMATHDKSIGDPRERFRRYEWPATIKDWQKTVVSVAARVQNLEDPTEWSAEKSVWEDSLLGFPGGGLWEVVRALADAYPDDPVRLDLTELARGGYLAEDGSDVATEGCRDPLIILTEGKSDARILRAAIDTLFPDYSDFIRFIDYDFAKAAGGVPEVVRFVRMFAGSGIKNRVLALFDNDTAGNEARDQLGKLPANVFTMCLPHLSLFELYPTEGPDGAGRSDISGRACSLELYLGLHALTDPVREECPVRWTGFNEKMGRYQGEIRDKGGVQTRFELSLKDVRENPSRRTAYDFSGIEAIFEAMLATVRTR